MLRGSVSAPPSARRSPAFGLLAAASESRGDALGACARGRGRARRGRDAGRLPRAPGATRRRRCRSSGGRRPPAARRRRSSPSSARGDPRGRARTACPRTSCSTTRRSTSCAARRPSTPRELAAVKGLGPTKIERYGGELLAVLDDRLKLRRSRARILPLCGFDDVRRRRRGAAGSGSCGSLALLLVLFALSAASFTFGLVTAVRERDPPARPVAAGGRRRHGHLRGPNSSASGACSRSSAATRAACSSTSETIAPIMKQAIVAVEDKRFYEHNGVDLRGIGRALWQDIRSQSVVEGGSTITQQFVKNAYIRNERTIAPQGARGGARVAARRSAGRRTGSSPRTSTRSTSATAPTASCRRRGRTSAARAPTS